ncbi:exodeoxyribonuclease VII large subunit [Rathayibacter toxicus]|uniref:Exodeoxyribonuclease 7 large subunit n=1 Tax=Rathayibacter toxicus TaxID=145458 RepID=A0A0C5BFR5_9MICO|nr:exodeoxyribonuclease VII large subunit [Rathayibacter toxicus]AJM77944.1 exodeoxyribonuclease VII large subunit [Rathayibacter toxicus]ALS57855.1 exodeoxyribonuclease VII large subunit [Rathayibacter toxicus]KKM46949.1 exodeoxyribonuclease VII large subunit [Rathayibacter toxicus]PPG20471.1 exodeoxyribonuclease VII large subunit [Rathayibacter toxicus]PPG45573.1 exodeoxyribonuclease VII large subunit [Rathayibacter toxicus]
MSDTPPTADAPWPVGLLATKLKGWIERLGTAWIEGEITQWGVSGGNVYGKLKDLSGDATVSFTIWSSVRGRLPADLAQGDRVIALIKPNYWLKGGTLSLQVFEMRHVGLGDLLEKLERLRQQLAAEGLFDPSRKRPLPFLPGGIGLITGKDSDAEKDVLRNAQLRWPAVRFRVVHAAVQGERTVSEVTAALRALDADASIDVIVIARGGGDFQNLLGFSDESLVRAVAVCSTPVVSAIGHEADRPLLDEVADLRASTPTDAAKRVVPDVSDELLRVQQAKLRMATRVSGMISHEIDRVAQLRSRPVLAQPRVLIDRHSEDLTRWVARGTELVQRQVESAQHKVDNLRGQLRALSPQHTLDRGYAIVQNEAGQIVRGAGDAPSATPLVVTLAEGAIAARSEGATADPASRGPAAPLSIS